MEPEIENKPLISIVVTVSNRPESEIRILEWIEETRNLPLELIFVLDGPIKKDWLSRLESNLDTYEIKAIFKFVQFLNPGLAREAGKRLATGQWILFWDCDDMPYNFKNLHSVCQSADLAWNFIVFNFGIKNAETNEIKLKFKMPKNLTQLALNPGIWRIAFRTSRILDIPFDELSMGEDQVFLAKCELEDREVVFIGETIYIYTTHLMSQLTRNTKALSNISKSTNLLKEYLAKSGSPKAYQWTILAKMHLSKARIDINQEEIFLRKLMILFLYVMNSRFGLDIFYLIKGKLI